jgi:hypothetical protein
VTVAEDFTSGFETEIGILNFEIEARGDVSWLGLEPVGLDYVISNLPTSQCHVFTEPHVITFDQHRFDFYGTGTFLLTRNQIDDFEVKLVKHVVIIIGNFILVPAILKKTIHRIATTGIVLPVKFWVSVALNRLSHI